MLLRNNLQSCDGGFGQPKMLTLHTPLHDREILFPVAAKPPAYGNGNIARSAVDVQQDGVAPVLPADRDPLIDPADLHRFEALDPVWRDNPARLGDDLGGVVAVARSGRLRICGGLDHRWERRAQRQPRQAGGDEKSSVHGLLPASSL